MRLENRLPDEGINASAENPLREFAWLVAGSIGVVVGAVFVVSLAAQWLAPRVPYAVEARLAATLPSFAPMPTDARGRAVQAELQALADRLGRHLEMPAGLTPRIGYSDAPTVNAYATLGGQTAFYRGLLEMLDSEDALAMVMAHELAHLRHRHPAAALGRGVAISLLLSMVSVDLAGGAAQVVQGAGMATLLSFNRDQERDADRDALIALQREYGHVGGALDLLDAVARRRESAFGEPMLEFLHTHPLTDHRAAAVRAWAGAASVPLDGVRRPLPPAIAALRAEARQKQRAATPTSR